MMGILEVKNVTKHFGGLVANSDVSFSVERGQVYGIVGPNGAGKTTMFNMISGTFHPTSGQILFKGEDITRKPAYEICKRHIGRTFQIPLALDKMTVLENVTVGAMVHTPKTETAKEFAAEILAYVGMEGQRDLMAESLSVIQKKRLEIARALSTKPELILLDESMAGLNGQERDDAIALIKKINGDGITVLMIEHVMRVVMSVCDQVLVLQNGMRIAEGTPEEITRDERVIAAYLGD
ncbi:MAG: ABC transporter ATP-binding protein [Lachnospiraceae bacterium]|nr:ABC transporter ATP-binding protein [Lachnospiraceae bacterium]